MLTVANDKTVSVEPQQDGTGVNNPTVPRVKNQTGPMNMDMPQSEPDGGSRIFWTRSG